MSLSKDAFRRARSLLGTIVTIEMTNGASSLMTGAFQEIERLEKYFNFHDHESLLSQFNRTQVKPASAEFEELSHLCHRIEVASKNSFFPYRDQALDLSGIAKGFIVDKTRDWIKSRNDLAFGCINAGGDIGFYNLQQRTVQLRLGSFNNAFMRSLELSRNSIAVSSIGAFTDPHVSRTYYQNFKERCGLTIAVQAARAAIADALTKVVLFAPPIVAAECCDHFKAYSHTFDANGALVESYGSP